MTIIVYVVYVIFTLCAMAPLVMEEAPPMRTTTPQTDLETFGQLG